MKSLVVYSSKTGNSKKIAETIYESLAGEKQICAVGDAPEPADFDLVSVAFWLMAGKPDQASQEYFSKISNQKVILAATHGAAKGSAHAENAMKFAKDLVPGADVLATFSCQGEVNPEFMKKALAKPQPPPWIGDAPSAKGHPDEKDVAELKKLIAGTISR